MRGVATLKRGSAAFLIATCLAASPVLAESPEQVDSEEQEPEHSAGVEELLRSAESALAANRLTTPAGNNALHFYNEVLKLDPRDRQAIEGSARVVNRYIQFAQEKLSRDDLTTARRYLDKALEIDPDNRTAVSLDLVLKRRKEESGGKRVASRAQIADLVRTASELKDILLKYKQAYESLSAEALQKIWPSLPDKRVEQLTRAFAGYKSMRMEIGKCNFSFSGVDPTVTCTVNQSIDLKAGEPISHAREIVFRFARSQTGSWEIKDRATGG